MPALEYPAQLLGVDIHHSPHIAQVQRLASFQVRRADAFAAQHIFTGHRGGLRATVLLQEAQQLAVDLLVQHLVHHLYGFFAGVAQAVDEQRLDAVLLKLGTDGFAAAMHQQWLQTGSRQKGEVAQSPLDDGRLLHGAAAKLDQDALTLKFLDVGQCLD